MVYMCDEKYVFTENSKCVEQVCRMFTYRKLLGKQPEKEIINENKPLLNKDVQQAAFWNKESDLERKIYMCMKKWETRHPIMGIAVCTILGGILISLIAGIILEAIMKII